MVNIINRLYHKASGIDKKYKHTKKENKQTTKLQEFLDKVCERTGGESSKW